MVSNLYITKFTTSVFIWHISWMEFTGPERLFIQCNRWDLVIRLHQSLGNWNKAITTAEQHHRMSLRGIHYSYAKELESTGQIKQAIEHLDDDFVEKKIFCAATVFLITPMTQCVYSVI
ncbi:unnamed protein product, partial [Trichobilharzia regenti]